MSNSTAKPFAIVTGASSGIGYQLAKQFIAGSLMTKMQGAIANVLPATANAEIHRKLAEPGLGDK